MHLDPLIRDLAIILGIAGVISLVFQRIRQPVVIGYIIAGVLIGPYMPFFQLITDFPSIKTWADLGVIFLMFSLGLEFSFRKLVQVGGSAILTATAEVLFFLPVGFWVGRAFGWSPMDGLFLGAMLSISSTTIILKALDELKLIERRFARLILGVLIVEDLIAVLLLVALGTVAVSQEVSAWVILASAFKLVLVVGGWIIAGYFIIPRFMHYAGRIVSDEVLTILSLGLCLLLVIFANHFQYSTALGAFIMGSIIAESPVLPRVKKSMASLRDVFGAIFFVSIGMLIDPTTLQDHLWEIAVICAVTVTGKLVITGLGALLSGQSFRNSVQVGFGLAQIGEFSFIIAQLGVNLKVTGTFIYPIAVAVSLVTTFSTPYLIRISGRAAEKLEEWLPEKLRIFLDRYAVEAEARRTGIMAGNGVFETSLEKGELRRKNIRALSRWFVNGITVSVVFSLCSVWLLPILQDRSQNQSWMVSISGWLAALVMSSPFIWAMYTIPWMEPRKTQSDKVSASVLFQVLTRILTWVWVCALSAEFFPGKYMIIVTSVALVVALILFYPSLEKLYQWFERNFLSTFEGHSGDHSGSEATFSHLVPWEAHLVSLEVHPNSKWVQRQISESAFRTRFGVNIVAIQRGLKAIVTPMPVEVFLPKDQLILLGTDEQVENVRTELEVSSEGAELSGTLADYDLRQAKLPKDSPFVGKSIRHSGIREKYLALIVGIEREGRRNITPDSDQILRPGDVIWIAGEKSRLNHLISEIDPNAEGHWCA